MSELLDGLNPEQKQAVTHTGGPLLIVAGAGTGKTTVLTRRIAWLIDEGHVKPEEVLALTFTDKAAGEMEERVDRLLPYGYVDLQISTFHAFCESILREYGAQIGLSQDFRLATELDAWLLCRRSFDRFALDYYRPIGNPTKYLRGLLDHFSRAKDYGVTAEKYAEIVKQAMEQDVVAEDTVADETAQLQELAEAYRTYQEVLLEHDMLDFGDLILFTIRLLRERPSVRQELQARYKHVMVDEFQDTNEAQYALVQLLALPQNNITIVGDDDQSIYQFRGASVKNILAFEEDYPETARVVLTSNYRSGQVILDAAHTFIQANNPHRLEGRKQTPIDKRLQSKADEQHARVITIEANTADEELSTVIKTIYKLKESQEDVQWNDFAILVRSNNSGLEFASALDRSGIPFQFMALTGLYHKPVILDALAFLRVLDNPFDSASFFRVLSMPVWAIDPLNISTLGHLAKKHTLTLFEATQQARGISDLSQEDLQHIDQLLDVLRRGAEIAKSKRVTEVLTSILTESGYLRHLQTLSEGKQHEEFSFLQQLYERLKSYEERSPDPLLHGFLEEYKHERDAGESGDLKPDLESGPDLVRVMTIHGAKGLEFRYVFVVHFVERRFPSQRRAQSIPISSRVIPAMHTEDPRESHLREERRLFYVALTRAKERIFLTHAVSYGGARNAKPSRFLQEMDETHLQPHEPVEVTVFGEEHEPPERSQNDARLPIPNKFSFTQLVTYQTCPLQYKFAHIFKIPMAGKWMFSYGKTMHRALELYMKRWIERAEGATPSASASTSAKNPKGKGKHTLLVDESDLLELYRSSWMDEWYINKNQRDRYYQQGLDQLSAFAAYLKDNPPHPYKLEESFTLKIDDIVLKGQIDRIDRVKGGVEIIDYKTGKAKKRLERKDKEQLLLYQIAAEEMGLTPVKLTYHYLETNEPVSFIGTTEETVALRNTIRERIEQIRSRDFSPDPGYHCNHCDFADICEYRQ